MEQRTIKEIKDNMINSVEYLINKKVINNLDNVQLQPKIYRRPY